jgi:hypothetical protein
VEQVIDEAEDAEQQVVGVHGGGLRLEVAW